MEQMILSLKNIYMTLMTEDFPIYSESVIGRAERKGQTMLRFWQSHVAEDFRSLPCGRMIWRNDGKRNRYTSYLCNRSAQIKTYCEYAMEIASQVGVSSLLNQVSQFDKFLSGRNYRHDILLRRIWELIRLTEIEDPRVNGEIADQIRASLSWQPESTQGSLFQASYLLTLLMLYAMAGEAMDDPVMAVLREEKYSIDAMYHAYMVPQKKTDALSFLTVHSGLLQDNPLPQSSFFGREEELFDLKEIVEMKGKRLITGIGGIGKTELLRQLLCRCQQEHIVECIAVVPYRNSIAESFVRCFPESQRSKPEEGFSMILHQLKAQCKQRKLLLLIDDLTNGTEEDPNLKRLAALDCGILITTRHCTIEGFQVFALSPPTIRTSALIFRDNYGQPLTEEDQLVLLGMLEQEALRHPLNLRLMARAARSKRWSVRELGDQLNKNGLSFSWMEEERIVRMTQLYRQLYSYMQMPEECHTIAHLFTVLPRDSYSTAFLCSYFPQVTGSEEELKAKLHIMSEGGWLEVWEDGWSMHPVIAQCLRRKTIPEKWLVSMFLEIQQTLDQRCGFDPMDEESEELQHLCGIFLYGAELLTGPISRGMMKTILLALSRLVIPPKASVQCLKTLERWMKRCHEQDDEIMVLYRTVQGRWHGATAAEFLAVYDRQKHMPTVSGPRMRSFCYYGAENLIYQQEYELAEMLLKELLCDDASAVEKAAAYYLLAFCSELRGDAETFLSWVDLGAKYVDQHPQCGERLIFHMNSIACGAYTKFGLGDAAQQRLSWLSQRIGSKTDPMDLTQYELSAGTYELHFGDPEKALTHYRNAQRFHEIYWENDPNFIGIMGQMAIAQQRLKRYDEALDTYLAVLEDIRVNGTDHQLHIYSNNISVVYLELNRPTDALTHLETAMILARQYGGIALAEVQRNRARAFHLMGDWAQELACLEEAAPLLEAAYGPDHPKSQATRQRLEELRQS